MAEEKFHLEARVEDFIKLGKYIKSIPHKEKKNLFEQAQRQNKWFVDRFLDTALEGISHFLKGEMLWKWVSAYNFEKNTKKNVGIAMAGNIPAVGFHDLLCVLITHNNAIIKQSSHDSIIIPFLMEKLQEINPIYKSVLNYESSLKGIDMFIGTGSNNTARYFEYYFSKIPHIIRKNRSSVAILTGKETKIELQGLSADIHTYFGLGCRNVSQIFIPLDYNFSALFEAMEGFSWLVNHSGYYNNYQYHRAVYSMNQDFFIENDFVILKQDRSYCSPISVLYFDYYKTKESLTAEIESHCDKIQVIVSNTNKEGEGVYFGETQYPNPWDYADKKDVLQFLLGAAPSVLFVLDILHISSMDVIHLVFKFF
ncbi:MAG: acyl-CoA reductase [Chitinophagaceae bacterium]|nr:acyl-CoA reductase [Chitinophagaceae bacterium]